MVKINTAEDLTKLRASLVKKRDPQKTLVTVCGGPGCLSIGSEAVAKALVQAVSKKRLQAKVEIKLSGCQGLCEHGPLVTIEPQGISYERVGRKNPEKDAADIVEQTLKQGALVDRFAYVDPKTGDKKYRREEMLFYQKQRRIVLRHTGRIDPGKIEDYIAEGGYSALAKALTMNPEEIIAWIEKSGLRGRGGGGFPTGRKWRSCRQAEGEVHYIVCNGDEGDPGAFMDRAVMEGDPHSVLEGMIIGAYAIAKGRSRAEGYIYVRNEYPLSVRNLRQANAQAEKYGLLGKNILGSGFDFRIKINRGGGAFVCGESSALMASLEGRAGEPRAKYVHTVERGLLDQPTNLNNVETWANVPEIIARGWEWFAQIGTKQSTGTKVFSLVGKVKNTGLVEVPMGISIRDLVFEVGGGILHDKKFKAIQTGGPSGGCIPANLADLPLDFDTLTEHGSMMGSGGLIVMDENDCMVDVARYFVKFLEEESCGKCVPCREGLRRLKQILSAITTGFGKESDLALMEELGEVMTWGSLCALGGTAANPVLSTIKYFRDEYEAHIRDQRCPAGVCTALITYSIDKDKCTGCHLCATNCPQKAISGEKKKHHLIDPKLCIKCGICYEVCKFDSVVRM
jgi:NADH-quinone oxidoreductase subunit F